MYSETKLIVHEYIMYMVHANFFNVPQYLCIGPLSHFHTLLNYDATCILSMAFDRLQLFLHMCKENGIPWFAISRPSRGNSRLLSIFLTSVMYNQLPMHASRPRCSSWLMSIFRSTIMMTSSAWRQWLGKPLYFSGLSFKIFSSIAYILFVITASLRLQ